MRLNERVTTPLLRKQEEMEKFQQYKDQNKGLCVDATAPIANQENSGLNEVKASAVRRWPSNTGVYPSDGPHVKQMAAVAKW